MNKKKAHQPRFRLWLEKDGKTVLGKGGAKLLENIAKAGTISEAIKQVKSETRGTNTISYRQGWGMLRKVEDHLGKMVVKRERGGARRGRTSLTKDGQQLLSRYNRLELFLQRALQDEQLWEALGLKISARNQLKGQVINVKKDGVAAMVKIKVEAPTLITAVITQEAVEQLGIEKGDSVTAVIKATEVLVAKG